MKSGVFLVALVGVFSVVSGGSNHKECPLKKALKASIDACKDKLSEESAKLMEADEFADNKEINCFHACMMTHSGLMTDGKMDIGALEELLTKDTEQPEEARRIVEAMKLCKPESETSNDKCKVASNYGKCLKAKKGE